MQIALPIWLKTIVCITAIMMGVLLGLRQATGEYNVVDTVSQAEHILKQAGKESPQWHKRQDAIERDIHDITFLLEQSWKAAEQSKHAERKDYAQQALTVLQRGVTLGHFDLAKTEPVVMLIRQLLSDQS